MVLDKATTKNQTGGGKTSFEISTVRIVLTAEPRKSGEQVDLFRVGPILIQPSGKGGILGSVQNESQVVLELFQKFSRMENVPCCNQRSVAKLTDPGETTLLLVIKTDDAVGKAAKMTPGDVVRPGERLLPIHPSDLVGVFCARVGHVFPDLATRRAASSAFAVTRVLAIGLDAADKTPREVGHKISDSYTMAVSR